MRSVLLSANIVGIAHRTGPTDLTDYLVSVYQQVLGAVSTDWMRDALTVLAVLIALISGRALARVIERTPVRLETNNTGMLSLGSRLEVLTRRRGRARSAIKHTSGVAESRTGLSRWLGWLAQLCVWLAALVAIALIWFSKTIPLTSTEQTTLGTTVRELVLHIGGTLLVVALTLGFARVLQRSAVYSLTRSHVNNNLALLGGHLAYFGVVVIGVVVVLALWGTGIVLPVALIGVLTLALSLALQDVLKNPVAGIYLLIERPFVIGDQIMLNPYVGEVEDVQIRYTALRTADGERVIIPNSLLFTQPVVNLSAYRRRRSGLLLTVPAAGPEALDSVEAQIMGTLKGISGVLDTPVPQIMLNRSSGGKMELQVIFWLPTTDFTHNAAVYSEVLEQVRARVPNAEVAALDPVGALP